MIDLGTLAASIVVNGAAQGISQLSEFGAASEQAENKSGSLSSSLAGKLATAAAGATAAVAAAGAAIYGIASNAAAATDRVDKMSQKIGISREAYQELDFICSQSGTSVDGLQAGMKTLTTAIDSNSESLVRLGVATTDANGNLRSQEDVLFDTLSALQSVENQTEKARLASELFGRSGTELMPLLNGAAGSIENMKEQAHELGLVLSDDAIDSGVQMTDMIDQLKRSFGSVTTQIGVSLMPIIMQLGSFIIDNMPIIQEVLSNVFAVLAFVVQSAVNSISNIITWLQSFVDACFSNGEEISNIWETIKQMFNEVFNNISELLSAFVSAFNDLWNKYGDSIIAATKTAFEYIQIVIGTAFDIINGLLNIFTDIFNGDWDKLWEDINKLITDIWSGIIKFVEKALDDILGFFKGIKDDFKKAGKAMFQSVWDGLTEIWDKLSDWVSEKVNWIADKLSFWRSSKDEMSEEDDGKDFDGSHRTGLYEVPYDDYNAILHRGEMVLTQPEADRYRNDIQLQPQTIAVDTNVNVEFKGSLSALGRVLEPYITKETNRKGPKL